MSPAVANTNSPAWMNKVWFPSMPAGVPGYNRLVRREVRQAVAVVVADEVGGQVPGAKFVCATKPLPVPR